MERYLSYAQRSVEMENLRRERKAVLREIEDLASTAHLTETNEGTFGPGEAFLAVGTGDPAFASYRRYETVGGAVRVEGPDPAAAPGHVRALRGNVAALRSDRLRLAALRERARELDRRHDALASEIH